MVGGQWNWGRGARKKKHLLFKSEEISTTGEDCSKGNSKEKDVRSLALRLDEAIQQFKSRIWEMKGGKYTKTLAKIWVRETYPNTKAKNPFVAKIYMNISFQLLLYIMKVKSQ